MRKFLKTLILVGVLSGCASAPEEKATAPALDHSSAIETFLVSNDPEEEQKILGQLKSASVSAGTIKDYLQTRSGKVTRQSGTLNQSFDYDGKSYPVSMYIPNPIPGKTYPMVIVLHGLGGNGDRTLQKWHSRLGEDFIILCPSYPMGAWWSKRAENMVLHALDWMRDQYPVDPNRVSLVGLSNGAIGTFMLGMFYPDRFAGIVPIAGSVTERYMHFLVNLINTPMYSIQGKYDPVFPIHFSRRIQKIMRDLDYPATYREHEQKGTAHGGHFLPEEEVPALVAWLKKQKRPVHPPVIRLIREANHLEPVQWVAVTRGLKLAALQIPGPEGEKVHVRDGKIATLMASRKDDNLIELMGKNILEAELYLNSDWVDFSKPLRVTFREIRDEGRQFMSGPERIIYNKTITPDIEILLKSYKARKDPNLMYEARVRISLEEKFQVASIP